MKIPAETRHVWWWALDREGRLINPDDQPARHEKSPPLKHRSPYTPNFLEEEDGKLPGAHLHIKDKKIAGIHGEATLTVLRLTLLLCLAHEELLIEKLDGCHPFPLIPLDEALALLKETPAVPKASPPIW